MKKFKPFSYFDVLEACTQPGCPFCRLCEKSVNSYLDALLYEQVNDPDTRGMLHQSLGFCNEHAWRLPEINTGVSLGIAIIYNDLISRVSEKLQHVRYMRPNGFSLRQAQELLDRGKPSEATEEAVRRLQPQAECPTCAHRNTMETISLEAMLEALPHDEQMQTALKASTGLCLPHLRRALELTRDEAAFNILLRIVQEKLAGLRADLNEFVRKNDYRFNKEGFGKEGDSWRRAIGIMVGAKGVRCD